LWKVAADPHTAEVAGQPEPLTQWTDFGFANLTVTDDGKILSFVKDRSWSDVYVGELSPDATSMTEPHRFTLDDRGSEQAVWMRDSRAIFFDSKRNGKREIFRQALDENVAAVVISGSHDVYGVDISPDGKWFLYWESASGASGGGTGSTTASSPRVDARANRRLMHRAVAGGSPEPLFRAPHAASGVGAFYCASNPKAVVPCVLAMQEGKELAFYSLDPVLGQGNRLGTIQVSSLVGNASWTVSSDGSRVVLVDEDKYSGRIELLDLLAGTRSEVSLDPGAGRLESVTTSADGRSFFVTTLVGGSSRLALVTPSGKVKFLLSSEGLRQFASSPMPSPDGKYLAFQAHTRDSNLWMIDSF
jgi:Tol biopolymer transport system component